uniref:Ig-like domain-containing protein n=1 Tax=Callorhinchus milii TaxID=7868 RepID=A0A4W3IBA3_CALMI
ADIIGQDTVSQSPLPVTVVEKEQVINSCSTTESRALQCVSWYRQSPGEGLKYLLHRKPSGEGGNPTGDHISASLDTAKKISVLTIADLRLTDSAMYHCALSLHHSDTHHRKPRTITLITTKAGNQYSTVSDIHFHLIEFISSQIKYVIHFLLNVSDIFHRQILDCDKCSLAIRHVDNNSYNNAITNSIILALDFPFQRVIETSQSALQNIL